MVHYFKERPPLIGACYFSRGESDAQKFVSDATHLLGDVGEAVIRYDAERREVKAVKLFYGYGEKEIQEMLIEPDQVLCKEKKEGGRVWIMSLDEFFRKYEAADPKF